jgi:hypothetical protein
MVTAQQAHPEFLSRNDVAPRKWNVQEGAPQRGDAWTDMRIAKMRVPFGADELSRTVRAHELMHAKVSPTKSEAFEALDIRHDCIIGAEEFRVNMLVGHQGFDLKVLADGSESNVGKHLGKNNDWNGVVRFMASIAGTKSAQDFLRGLKTTNPDFEKNAREIQKVLLKRWRQTVKRDRGVKEIASTVEIDGMPFGFRSFTLSIARFLESLMIHEGAEGAPDEFGNDEVPDVAKVAKGNAGQFAKLIEDVLPKPCKVDGRLGRKRVATNIGKNPRRINRMLVDPEKRVFDRRARGRGGIVVIDQSGSMRLSTDDIWRIIESAPGCVIVGYSHSPGTKTVPNVWVLADRGTVVESVRKGNGGNGVDGPALRFALAKRRNNEPVIWVCDGMVTDGANDSEFANLTAECASIVTANGIHMVCDVDDAVKALERVARGEKLPTQGIGEVRRQMQS